MHTSSTNLFILDPAKLSATPCELILNCTLSSLLPVKVEQICTAYNLYVVGYTIFSNYPLPVKGLYSVPIVMWSTVPPVKTTY